MFFVIPLFCFLFCQIFAAAYFLCIFYFAIACVILFAVSRPFFVSFAAAGETGEGGGATRGRRIVRGR